MFDSWYSMNLFDNVLGNIPPNNKRIKSRMGSKAGRMEKRVRKDRLRRKLAKKRG